MTESWTARKMVAGKDTVRVMATHYGLKPSTVLEIIKAAEAPLFREDGYRGYLHTKTLSGEAAGKPSVKRTTVMMWSDGTVGVDPLTTKLTKAAIRAVALWAWRKSNENDGDK
jgi:hypothetical protein